jgi:hypothetical protein
VAPAATPVTAELRLFVAALVTPLVAVPAPVVTLATVPVTAPVTLVPLATVPVTVLATALTVEVTAEAA